MEAAETPTEQALPRRSRRLAVWSFWSRPFFLEQGLAWPDYASALRSWIYSIGRGRRLFRHTMLVTDRVGAQLLVDHLQLPFDRVSLALEGLRGRDPHWWALGKLQAYRVVDRPFVHVDSDVYIWKPLPGNVIEAPLLAQNPEQFVVGENDYYMPHELEYFLLDQAQGWLPREWLAERTWRGPRQRALNCGIFGGSNLEFIRRYANLAFQILDHPANRGPLAELPHKERHILLLEQYLLQACLDYDRLLARVPAASLRLECLFPTTEDAYRGGEQAGYTHLLGKAKSDAGLVASLRRRVEDEFPEACERLEALNLGPLAEAARQA